MTDTFERFYNCYGGITYTFNNILLEPPMAFLPKRIIASPICLSAASHRLGLPTTTAPALS